MSLSHTQKRNIFFLLAYYLLGIALVAYFNESGNYKTGPCNPGLDTIFTFLYFLVNLILLIISIFKTVKNRSNKYLLYVNLGVTAALVLFVAVSCL